MPMLRNQIRCRGIGTIYGHVFENKSVGLDRQLYWCISLDCDPIRLGDTDVDCSFSTEWIILPVQSWNDLNGVDLTKVRNPELVEASLYLGEHVAVTLILLKLDRIANTPRFRVHLEASVDIDGFGVLDVRNIHFSLNGEADFEGIVIVPDNLRPRPNTPVKATAVVSAFISLRELGKPEWQRFRFLFPPA